jgi:hypothetical protein
VVAERLRALGLDLAVMPDSVREPFLAAAGTRLIVRRDRDSAEVLVFIYGDAGAVARDVEKIDTSTVAPRTMKVAWRAPAALVTDNNLVAIVLAESEPLRRRIINALQSHEAR